MDNGFFHKEVGMKAGIKMAGYKLLDWPPYSPDPNREQVESQKTVKKEFLKGYTQSGHRVTNPQT
jgi:hypothetical protein